jgi:hypothetical protein
MLDACVIDQNIAATRIGDQLATRIWFGHISRDIHNIHTELSGHVSRKRMVFGAIGKRIQHNPRTGLGHFTRNSQPDARVGSGDDGGFSCMLHLGNPVI